MISTNKERSSCKENDFQFGAERKSEEQYELIAIVSLLKSKQMVSWKSEEHYELIAIVVFKLAAVQLDHPTLYGFQMWRSSITGPYFLDQIFTLTLFLLCEFDLFANYTFLDNLLIAQFGRGALLARRLIYHSTAIPHICHFFYTGKIFGE